MSTETKQCPECGEAILAVAKRCKHCQADFAKAQSSSSVVQTGSGLDIGAALLVVPVVSTLLAWFWIANMNLLQSPGNSLALLVVGTVCVTAILAALEASKVGTTTDRKKGTYSPIQWFFVVALLWIVGYPAYMFKRRNYGLKNYLLAGLTVMGIFFGSVVIIQSAIDDKIGEVRKQLGMAQNDSDSLISEFVGLFWKSPAQKERESQDASDVERKVVAYLNSYGAVQASVAEYFANTGNMPDSCPDISRCGSDVSVGNGGRVIVNLNVVRASQVAGKSIVLVPSVNADNDLSWTCTSDADSQFIPSVCQHSLTQIPATATAQPPAATPATAVAPVSPESVTAQDVQSSQSGTPASTVQAPAIAVASSSAVSAEAAAMAPAPIIRTQAVPSFDCAKAASAVEKLICSNSDLASADSELAAFYKKNIAASGADSATIRQGQRAFISTRNQCSTSACIAEAYRSRHEALAQLGYVRE